MNIFEHIPEDLSQEVFQRIGGGGRVNIERIISNGHCSTAEGWYDQEQNEWVIVLKGEAIIGFENDPPITLKAGDYVSLEAHKRHKVLWTAPEMETIWLAVHY